MFRDWVALAIISACILWLGFMANRNYLEIRALKQQLNTQQAFIDSQLEWNETSTADDTLSNKRSDILEQKMRKVYGG